MAVKKNIEEKTKQSSALSITVAATLTEMLGYLESYSEIGVF
jgi:hypothetical protein